MLKAASILYLVASLLLVMGCAREAESGLSITTDRVEYMLDGSVEVEVTFRNGTGRAVTINQQGMRRPLYLGERRTADGWELAIAPIFTDGYIPPFELDAGEVSTMTLQIGASSIIGPQRDEYRLVFEVHDRASDELLPLHQRVSNVLRIE